MKKGAIKEKSLCLCGCGNRVKTLRGKYCRGHQTKNSHKCFETKIKELSKENHSEHKIAKILNISRSSVHYWLKDEDYRKENIFKQSILYKERKTKNSIEDRCRLSLANAKAEAKKRGHLPCTSNIEKLIISYTGYCNICGKSEIENGRNLSMDHDHYIDGRFRSWLCDKCNRTLGYVEDSIEKLEKFIEYLKTHK